MNSINQLLGILSQEYQYEIFLRELTSKSEVSQEIAFKIDSQFDTFHLKLSRSWKSSRIEFVPGSFASQIVNFLSSQAMEHKAQIWNLVASNKATLSDFNLSINGIDFQESVLRENNNQSFMFNAEVMTPDSSIEHGLLNEKEEILLRFAVSVFAILLPKSVNSFIGADEAQGFPEGAVTQVLVNKYERDPRNRAAAIKHYGYKCLACDFDFKNFYGDIGEEFIIVHHTVPVSKLGDSYILDPIRDLVTLCANCHAMIHRSDPPYSLDELRQIVGRS